MIKKEKLQKLNNEDLILELLAEFEQLEKKRHTLSIDYIINAPIGEIDHLQENCKIIKAEILNRMN